MRKPDEIAKMYWRLEADIWAEGFDPAVDAAAKALQWVLDDSPLDFEAFVRRCMERPEADRRREWVARGGDPDQWVLGEPEVTP